MTALPPFVDWEVVRVQKVVDGDTVDLIVRREIGVLDAFSIQAVGPVRVRLVHLDTPERDEKVPWKRATEDLKGWLGSEMSYVGLRLVTQGVDAFGRDLGDIYSAADRKATASDFMIKKGWSVWTG